MPRDEDADEKEKETARSSMQAVLSRENVMFKKLLIQSFNESVYDLFQLNLSILNMDNFKNNEFFVCIFARINQENKYAEIYWNKRKNINCHLKDIHKIHKSIASEVALSNFSVWAYKYFEHPSESICIIVACQNDFGKFCFNVLNWIIEDSAENLRIMDLVKIVKNIHKEFKTKTNGSQKSCHTNKVEIFAHPFNDVV